MKIGLIARAEIARGIAIQSKGFYDHMPVERVLLVDMPRKDCEVDESWYPGATKALYNDRYHELDEALVRDWLAGLDVVFSVETPNDWRMPTWCRQMGVKMVIQGNPEFVRHGQAGVDLAHPDEWWWPTSWRLDYLPPGVLMPVPMDDVVPQAIPAPPDVGPLRIVHVIGKRAHADRNGTEAFIDSLRSTREDIHVTIYAIDGSISEVRRQKNVTVDRFPMGVTDRWEMYDNQHLLVLPRRYGGLCLPALEASAVGLGVMMPRCAPNHELASILVSPRRHSGIRMACGIIDAHDCHPAGLASSLDEVARDRSRLVAAMQRSTEMVPRWSQWRDKYLRRLEEVCS